MTNNEQYGNKKSTADGPWVSLFSSDTDTFFLYTNTAIPGGDRVI